MPSGPVDSDTRDSRSCLRAGRQVLYGFVSTALYEPRVIVTFSLVFVAGFFMVAAGGAPEAATASTGESAGGSR